MIGLFKNRKTQKIIGGIGLVFFAIFFILYPSWPTPDKIFIFLFFLFLVLGDVWGMVKRFVPFIALILAYESFRGLADNLNTRIEFTWMPQFDEALFGVLPTEWLQLKLWDGSIGPLEIILYIVYMLHFVLPFALAVAVWKKRDSMYWRYAGGLLLLSYMGFITFLLFPAAPPWMASEQGVIDPIQRISSDVWWWLGLRDFPTVYDAINPNPVAAVPSLHGAYSLYVALSMLAIFKKSIWAKVVWLYPLGILFGSVYLGEHYVIDLLLGYLYAGAAFVFVYTCDFSKLRRFLPIKNV